MKNLVTFYDSQIKTGVGGIRFLFQSKVNKDILLSKRNCDESREVDTLICSSNEVLTLLGGNVKSLFKIEDLLSLPTYDIVGMKYDSLFDSIEIVLKDGTVVVPEKIDNHYKSACVLTELESAVDVVEWSPNLESCVIVSGNVFYVLAADYYVIYSNALYGDNLSEENALVNVGWGKKETQFQGSRGKITTLEKEEPIPSAYDDKSIHISWRKDGNYFAISFWNFTLSKRQIKVYNSSGSFHSCNEELPGLEGPICWKPNGENIAFCQRVVGKYSVSFLQRNGLKHGSFDLPVECKVKVMKWNYDSTILFTLCEYFDGSNEHILLWTRGNYHWYIKQRIVCESSLNFFLWDESRSGWFTYALSDGTIHTVGLVKIVNHSKDWHIWNNKALVGVIDDNKIYLTSFAQAVIPPPMSRWIITCQSTLKVIAFPSWNENDFENNGYLISTLLSNNNLVLYSLDGNEPREESVLNMPEIVGRPISHLWITPDKFVLHVNNDNNLSTLFLLQLSNSSLIVVKHLDLEALITTVVYDHGFILMQTTDGCLIKVNDSLEDLIDVGKLPEPCLHLEFCKEGIFSISENDRLYCNDISFSSVTSFVVYNSFLMFTTQDKLHTYKLKQGDSLVELPERKIELGARIVTAWKGSLLFQLPRGNLEAIQPRSLTLLEVAILLDQTEYKLAIQLLRKQRIDLNIIFDYDPEKYFVNIDKFISEVDVSLLTLFVTEMKSENVIATWYPLYFSPIKHKPYCNKLLKLGNSLREAMMKKDQNKYLLPILGTFVKTDMIEEALTIAACTENSIEHLLFLVDEDKLYEKALSVYNLEAALMVVKKSQKDPKEYLPFLDKLKSMDPCYMKYYIDKMLKNPKSALFHISHCEGDDNFSECLDLIKTNVLYLDALEIFKDNKDKYKIILDLYGDYLCEVRLYEEAGIMYKRSGKFQKAIDCFCKVGMWRECITLSNMCALTDAEKEFLINKLISVLCSACKYSEAASLCLQLSEHPEQCIDILVEGKLWSQALFICETKCVGELSTILTALGEHANNLLDHIKNSHINYTKHFKRLQEVIALENTESPIITADPWENFSEASSVASLRSWNRSTSSSRASRNTRKACRKLWSLKEGNPREKQALMMAMKNIIVSVINIVEDVSSTCLMLVELTCDEKARLLQFHLKALLDYFEHTKPLIWQSKDIEAEIALMDEQLKMPPSVTVPINWELHCLQNP